MMRVVVGATPVIVAVAPKAGYSSVLQWMLTVQTGVRSSGQPLYERLRELQHVPYGFRDPAALKIAVHREGVSRAVSAFVNFVERSHDRRLSSLPLEAFATNICELQRMCPNLQHHTRLQADDLGWDQNYYDVILTTDQLSDLPNVIEEHTGEKSLPLMQRENATGRVVDVSERSFRFLRACTAYDRETGWGLDPSIDL